MLRRWRGQTERDARVFLGARPVPTRVAGYAPVPLDTGRAPKGNLLEVPPANPATTAFPPKQPIVLPPGGFPTLPPSLIIGPPGVTPPPCEKPNPDGTCPKPPCPNPNPDGTCPTTPPPADVPEPAAWLILIAGVAAVWFGLSGRRRRA